MIDLNAIQLDDQSMVADAMLRIVQDIVAPLLDSAGYEVAITKRHNDGTVTDTRTPQESAKPGQGGPGVPLRMVLTTCEHCRFSVFANDEPFTGEYAPGAYCTHQDGLCVMLIGEHAIENPDIWPPIPQWCPIADKEGHDTLSKNGKNEATEGRERGQILIDVKPRPGLQAEGDRT